MMDNEVRHAVFLRIISAEETGGEGHMAEGVGDNIN